MGISKVGTAGLESSQGTISDRIPATRSNLGSAETGWIQRKIKTGGQDCPLQKQKCPRFLRIPGTCCYIEIVVAT
jgi:hypothetical protein